MSFRFILIISFDHHLDHYHDHPCRVITISSLFVPAVPTSKIINHPRQQMNQNGAISTAGWTNPLSNDNSGFHQHRSWVKHAKPPFGILARCFLHSQFRYQIFSMHLPCCRQTIYSNSGDFPRVEITPSCQEDVLVLSCAYDCTYVGSC